MTFNHDTDVLTKALGIDKTGEQLAHQMAMLTKRYLQSDNDMLSHLAEMIHEELSYQEILMLATIDTYRVINEAQNATADDTIKKLHDLLKKLNSDD